MSNHSALYVPADENEPIQTIVITTGVSRGPEWEFNEIQDLLGGKAIGIRSDHDAMLIVESAGTEEPRNVRATDYILMTSEARSAITPGRDVLPGWGIQGDTVIVGMDQANKLSDVPNRIIEHFDDELLSQQIGQRWQVGYAVDGNIESLSPAMSHLLGTEVLTFEVQYELGHAIDEGVSDQIEALEEGEGFEVDVDDRTYFLAPDDHGLGLQEAYGYRLGYGFSA